MDRNLSISNSKTSVPWACVITVAIIALVHLIEVFFLPINRFTYRFWETMMVTEAKPFFSGPFYPNMNMTMVEVGDRGYGTPWAVKRRSTWISDEYGFRTYPPRGKYDVVIVGDSLIAGSGLDQEDTISAMLSRKLGKNVYPFAPSSMRNFFSSRRFNVSPPQIVIYQMMERSREVPALDDARITRFSKIRSAIIDTFRRISAPVAIVYDRIMKSPMQQFLVSRLEEYFLQSSNKNKWLVVPAAFKEEHGTAQHTMLFKKPEKLRIALPDELIKQQVAVLSSYRDALARRGIRFMFLPVPMKESVYYRLIGMKKPVYLRRFIEKVQDANIEVIDLPATYEKILAEGQYLLYQPDDSHWNSIGVAHAVDLIAAQLTR